jgi:hypothetical protein
MIEGDKIQQVRIKPVRLFLDDISRLAEIMGEVSADVKIVADEYELKDVDELAKLGLDTVEHLVISSDNPAITLEFSPFSASLSCSDKVPRRIQTNLRSFLQSRQRKLAWLFRNTVPAILAGFSFTLALIGINRGVRLVIFGSILLFVLSVLWAWWGFRSYFQHYSLIVLKPRADQSSFMLRNRDSMVISAFFTMVGIAIPFIVSALLSSN